MAVFVQFVAKITIIWFKILKLAFLLFYFVDSFFEFPQINN